MSLCSNVMMESSFKGEKRRISSGCSAFRYGGSLIIYRVNVGESRNQGIGVITVDNRLLNSMGSARISSKRMCLTRFFLVILGPEVPH